MRKKLVLFLVLAFTVFGLVACDELVGEKTDQEILDDVVASITVLEKTNDTFNLVTSKDGVSITWTSSNEDIIEIADKIAVVTRASQDVTVTLTATFEFAGLKRVETYEVVVEGNESEEMLVTFKVTLPENTPADAEIYIAGNFAAHTDLPDWDEAGAKATRSGNIAEITIPFAITSAITLEYKWTRGSWATVESAADQINDISNRSVSIDPANSDLVINDDILGWKDAPGGEELDEAVDVSVTFVLTVPENTPMDEDIYIVGEINKISDDYPNWAGEGSENTKLTRINATEASITLNFKTTKAIAFEYKYTRGSWDNEEVTAGNGAITNRTFVLNLEELSPTITDTIVKWKDLEYLGDEELAEHTLNFIVTIPEDTVGRIFVVGDFNGWNLDTALELIKQEDGTYKATTVYKSDEAGFEYKYINELGWDYEEINPQGWDNRYIAIDNEVLNITDTVEAWKDGGYKGV